MKQRKVAHVYIAVVVEIASADGRNDPASTERRVVRGFAITALTFGTMLVILIVMALLFVTPT